MNDKKYPPAIKVTITDTLNLTKQMVDEIGWYLFENKNYTESISYFKRGIQLYPEDFNMKINLAHLYLFNNDYKSAIAIYKANQNATISPGKTWEDVLKSDYTYFRDHNYDVKIFDSVFAELKLKNP